jgi:hypothetical protein
MKVQLHVFLNLQLDGEERSVSRPGRFGSGEGVPFEQETAETPEPAWKI